MKNLVEDESHIKVILLAREKDPVGERLRKIADVLVSEEQRVACGSVAELKHHLESERRRGAMGLLMVADQTELSALLAMQNLLIDFPFILVLPDGKERTIRKAHSLAPRFISYADGDLTDVAAVTAKMIENLKIRLKTEENSQWEDNENRY